MNTHGHLFVFMIEALVLPAYRIDFLPVENEGLWEIESDHSERCRNEFFYIGFFENYCITGEKWFASGESKIFRLSRN